jgi:hypothetical protein
VDPAIEKWYHMKENTAYNLRLNKRLVGIGGVFLFAIPGFVYYLSKKYNVTILFNIGNFQIQRSNKRRANLLSKRINLNFIIKK